MPENIDLNQNLSGVFSEPWLIGVLSHVFWWCLIIVSLCFRCGNLNFARREYCNHCNRVRFGHRGVGPGGSPHRRYIGPPSPRGPWPRIPGPPMNHGPERYRNEYDSPPREWGRDSPGSFGMDPPSTRHGGRFPDHIRRERPSYREDDEFSGRNKLDILMPPERGHKGRGNGDFFHERRRYDVRDERQPPPPPPPPLSHRDHWVHDGRERSRSPMRGGPKDYRRVPYMGRGRADRRDFVRMRIQTRYWDGLIVLSRMVWYM